MSCIWTDLQEHGRPGHPQKEDTRRVESLQSENTKVNNEKVCGGLSADVLEMR